MSRIELDRSVGYELKRTQVALRSVMDRALAEHDLTVPQYSCLEHLAHRPGLSNVELARGVFVTRQAMHQLLAGLRGAGLVSSEGTGRRERFSATADGRRRLDNASRAVAAIETGMLATLPPARRERLRDDLVACTDALSGMDR